jgi:hypothetical protein
MLHVFYAIEFDWCCFIIFNGSAYRCCPSQLHRSMYSVISYEELSAVTFKLSRILDIHHELSTQIRNKHCLLALDDTFSALCNRCIVLQQMDNRSTNRVLLYDS